MSVVYAGIGAAIWVSRGTRMLIASGLQVVITLGTGASLVLQRYVAEVEDTWR